MNSLSIPLVKKVIGISEYRCSKYGRKPLDTRLIFFAELKVYRSMIDRTGLANQTNDGERMLDIVSTNKSLISKYKGILFFVEIRAPKKAVNSREEVANIKS